jgi:hypothetical protein
MPTFNDELVVERTGDWNSPDPTIGTESLMVTHSENGTAPGVTFANVGGGHFLHQFTFGANSGLPGGVAASFCADWHGLKVTGQQGLLFALGEYALAPPIEEGRFVFANGPVQIDNDLSVAGQVNIVGNLFAADVVANDNLIVWGTVEVSKDVFVEGKLKAAQIVSPTIDSLQATIQASVTNSQLDSAVQNLQGQIDELFQAVALIQATGGSS